MPTIVRASDGAFWVVSDDRQYGQKLKSDAIVSAIRDAIALGYDEEGLQYWGPIPKNLPVLWTETKNDRNYHCS